MRRLILALAFNIILANISCQQNIMPQQRSSATPIRFVPNVWQKVFTGGGFFGSISFGDKQNGIVTDLNERLWMTADGGHVWNVRRISRESTRKCGEYDLVKSTLSPSGDINVIGHLEGVGSAIFTSLDGGTTWAINCYDNSSLNDIDAIGEHLWIVGTINSVSVVLHSQSQGIWQQIWTGSNQQYLTAVDFIDANTGWAVGASGLILHTIDGGRTWSAQQAPSRENLESVNFADMRIGYAVGQSGIIFYTSDGGNTWTKQESGTQAILTSVVAVSPSIAWTVGQKGTVLYTNDAGQHWNQQDIGTQGDINAITIKANEIWIATSDGSILRSSK